LKDIILTSRIFEQEDMAFRYAKKYNFLGIEWYLNKKRLTINPENSKKFFNKMKEYNHFIYAFHLPTTDVEIGYYKEKYAETSLDYLMMYIDFLEPWMKGLEYRPVFTMHIGASSISMDRLDWQLTKKNLKKLGDHIHKANGILCLENLKMGWTADPEKLLELAEYAGISVTFDAGHAASSPLVQDNRMGIVEYMTKLSPYMKHVHFYSYESLTTGKHLPPDSWEEVKDIWTALSNLEKPKSITLELTSVADLEQTIGVLDKSY